MNLLLALLHATVILSPTSQAAAGAVRERQTSRATVYHHRAYHDSIILGDYLYIDGGEITAWNGIGDGIDGVSTDGNLRTLPDNHTYTFDLSADWTNATTTFNTIQKPRAAVLNGAGLWLDASKKSFYAYGGGISRSRPSRELPSPPVNALWQFTPDGNSGTWSDVPLQPASNFTSLLRLMLGAYASGNGLGFALGGYESWRTTTADPIFSSKSFVPTPGLVIYNTTSQDWLNVTTSGSSGFSQYGWSTEATAWFVPSFGPAGLLAVLGGQTADGQLVSLEYIHFFDPASQTWSFQKTSGTSPAACLKACMVGAQGDNNTYEIFFYGGTTHDVSTSISNGVVYVLSLPSFNWQKQAETPTYARHHHTCNVASGGQMIAVGGVIVDTSAISLPNFNSLADPWPQGLGVFDMTEMEWKDSYTANAAPYVTPKIVKDYYGRHGRFPDSWDSPALQAIFTSTGSKDSADSTSGIPALTTSKPPSESSKHSNTGAIAGGAVGGLAGLALLLLAGCLFLRRQRRQRRERHAKSVQVSHEHIDPPDKPELDSSQHSWGQTHNDVYTRLDGSHQNWSTTDHGDHPPVVAQLDDDNGTAGYHNNNGAQQLGGEQIYELEDQKFPR